MKPGRGAVCLLIVSASLAEAQPTEAPKAAPKQAQAVRVPNNSLRLDGRLDEALWAGIPAISDFVQKDPVFGVAPSEGIELRFAYDDEALWVGARMEVKGRKVQAPLTRRDDTFRAEHLRISLDTYHDKRTAYSYGVGASGVQQDLFHENDSENFDPGYNPVWEVKTHRSEHEWTAEFRIPFSQLRFNADETQVWGLNVRRWIPSTNEDVFWIAIPRNETGWASRMGELHGISGIKPTRRVELLPYVAGTGVAGENDGTPFRDGWDQRGRAGLDFKMGLGPNLTLESTIRPDFGQVEADPAQVNLTAFETFFTEKRPFFTEGAAIFNAVSGFFYSRRIGGPPRGTAAGDAVQYPRNSEILGAAKITGRLASGLSVGGLFALTGQEEAKIFDARTGRTDSQTVGPRTTYSVVRLRQEFGGSNSAIGLFLSGVTRSFDAKSPLASIYNKNAFASAVDFSHRFGNRTYELRGNLAYTRVAGEPADIERLQRSSARYFQRPDATHVHLDPTRRSLDGGSGELGLSRNQGRVIFDLGAGFESPETERNDVGSLSTADGVTGFAALAYRQTKPGRFRFWQAALTGNVEQNYAGELQHQNAGAELELTWRNYWTSYLEVERTGAAQDQRLTRGGPTMGTPPGWSAVVHHGSSIQRKTRLSAALSFSGDDDGGSSGSLVGTASFQPRPQFIVSLSPSYSRSTTARQYVDTLAGGRAVTFGERYVFAKVDQTTFVMGFRASLILTPDLALDVYAEPFAASGRYYDYGELLAPRSRKLREYGGDLVAPSEIGNNDFRELSFRSNVVLRWEYRPGSTFYAVWQQDRSNSAAYARAGFADLLDSVSARGDNIFAIKASFFWAHK